MQRLTYCSGTSMITGDAIAHALLDYAVELVRFRQADVVEIPVVREDGSTGTTRLLLSPTTQLAADALPATPQSSELESRDLVQILNERTAALLAPPLLVLDGLFGPEHSGDVV